jgi:hypothetical protein
LRALVSGAPMRDAFEPGGALQERSDAVAARQVAGKDQCIVQLNPSAIIAVERHS